MIENIYNGFLVFAMCIMALIAFAYLARAVSGPKFADRILAVNGIQTIIILIICILVFGLNLFNADAINKESVSTAFIFAVIR